MDFIVVLLVIVAAACLATLILCLYVLLEVRDALVCVELELAALEVKVKNGGIPPRPTLADTWRQVDIP